MDNDCKVMEHKRLQNSSDPFADISMLHKGFSCSVPMKHMRMMRYDWAYGDYVFRTLRNSDDYERAGRDLHNCLSRYYGAIHESDENENDIGVSFSCQNENTVVGVIKNLKYVAAIDVNYDGTVGFSAIERNQPITCNPRLFSAYLAWIKRFGLLDLQYHR